MKHPTGRILIFAKAPLRGQVKRRLAKDIGEAEATRIYAAMLEYVVTMAVDSQLAPVTLCVTPGIEHPLFHSLVERFGVELKLQQGADLGERMLKAMASELEKVSYVVLIGSDCPLLDEDYLAQALDALEQGREAVFGPVEDGGYVLVGLRQAEPALFQDIPWGGDRVMAITRDLCVNKNLQLKELAPLYDIDRSEDLERFNREYSGRLASIREPS
jgi:rSAM/selenodomain-associated transferase 1